MRELFLGVLLAAAGCSAPPVPETGLPAPAAAVSPAAVPPAAEPAVGGASLAGRVAYPSEELPAMRVCAIDSRDPGTAVCTRTAVNAPHWSLSVPAGAWWLLAWPQDTGTPGDPGLLSEASDCLGSGGTGCDDHALKLLVVADGDRHEGLDINDWYYDPQAFPPPMPPRDDAP